MLFQSLLGPDGCDERGPALQPEEWCSYMNDDGQIENIQELNEKIFKGVSALI